MHKAHESQPTWGSPRTLLAIALSAFGIASLLFAVSATTAAASEDRTQRPEMIVPVAPGAKRAEVGALDDDRDPADDDTDDTDDTGGGNSVTISNDEDTDDTGGGNVNAGLNNDDDTDDNGSNLSGSVSVQSGARITQIATLQGGGVLIIRADGSQTIVSSALLGAGGAAGAQFVAVSGGIFVTAGGSTTFVATTSAGTNVGADVDGDDTDDTGGVGGNVNINNDDTDDTGGVGGNVNINDDDTDDTGGGITVSVADDDTDDTGGLGGGLDAVPGGVVMIAADGTQTFVASASPAGQSVATTAGTAQFFAVPGGMVMVASDGTRTFVASSSLGAAPAMPVEASAGLAGAAPVTTDVSPALQGGVVAAAPAPASTGSGGYLGTESSAAAAGLLAGFATVLGAGWPLMSRKAARTRNR